MAYLNLRERRIEAKIAYVGAALAGRGTHFFEHLVGKVEKSIAPSDDVISLAWQPSALEHFKDCAVYVNLVASDGSVAEKLDDFLRGADGVVVVVDASPTAEDRNRAAVTAVKEAIARGERPGVPVLLQVDQVDVPETAQAALEQVLAALQAERPSAAAEAPNRHPLLDALRQVFRETVKEQVGELERRMTAQFEKALELHEKRSQADVGLAIQVVEQTQEASATLASISTRLDRLRADRDQQSVAAAGTKKSIEALSADIRALDGRFDELAPRIDEIEASTVQRSARVEQSVRSFGIDLTAALASTHEKIAAVETRVSEIVEELKKPKKGWFT